MGWNGIAAIQSVSHDCKDAYGNPMHIECKSTYSMMSDQYRLFVYVNEQQVVNKPGSANKHNGQYLCGMLDDYSVEHNERQRWNAEVLYDGALVPWGGWRKE